MTAEHDHFDLVMRAMERYRKAAWDEHAKDPKFCYICGFRGYQLIAIAILEEELAATDLSAKERQEIAGLLAQTVGMAIPTHDKPPTAPMS